MGTEAEKEPFGLGLESSAKASPYPHRRTWSSPVPGLLSLPGVSWVLSSAVQL